MSGRVSRYLTLELTSAWWVKVGRGHTPATAKIGQLRAFADRVQKYAYDYEERPIVVVKPDGTEERFERGHVISTTDGGVLRVIPYETAHETAYAPGAWEKAYYTDETIYTPFTEEEVLQVLRDNSQGMFSRFTFSSKVLAKELLRLREE